MIIVAELSVIGLGKFGSIQPCTAPEPAIVEARFDDMTFGVGNVWKSVVIAVSAVDAAFS